MSEGAITRISLDEALKAKGQGKTDWKRLALEEEAGFVYHMLPGSGVMRITDAEGREHLLPGRFHRWGVERDFMRIDADLTASGIQVIGRIGEAESRLVDAARMWDEITDRLKMDSPHYGEVFRGESDDVSNVIRIESGDQCRNQHYTQVNFTTIAYGIQLYLK